jgi:hypothetical protein
VILEKLSKQLSAFDVKLGLMVSVGEVGSLGTVHERTHLFEKSSTLFEGIVVTASFHRSSPSVGISSSIITVG